MNESSGPTSAPGRARWLVAAAAAALVLGACASTPPRPPLTLAAEVDLGRFMGDWYVIAAIPTVFEHGVHAPKEHYALEPDGSVATTFSFNAGGFDGPRRDFRSRGYVVAGSGNAAWGQQYVWPFRADYRIAWLASDYRQVVIGREKRDHVWIMARTPTLSDADYARLQAVVAAEGYDLRRLERMPQRAASDRDRP